MSSRIEVLALRVENDGFFMASALRTYARSERLDRAGLAAALGCSVASLGSLGLCRRPRPERLHEDVARIGARFDLDGRALLEVVRRSDALDALRQAQPGHGTADGSTAYMAARDRRNAKGPDGHGRGSS